MYIGREIKDKFGKIAAVYPIVALVGARQSGKTTFLKEEIKKLNANYLLFDDPDIRNLFEEDIKKFEKQFLNGKDLSIFDEVQYCKGAGEKLKYLADTGKKVWLTSSSESILSKEVLSYLVGRVSIVRVYPFSLLEFLKAKDQKEFTPAILERMVWEHMRYGGYPKVVITEDNELKKTILRDLYETMILKDIANVFSIENIKSLEDFSRYLALNIGSQISYENISRDLKISFQTIIKYLDAMEKSYLIAKILPFFTNKIKEITKQPKIYFIDTGMRNGILNNFSQEEGRLFENYVLGELIKKGFSVKYWRTKTKMEVDFIVEKENEFIPIEVKFRADANKIEKNLRAFVEKYKPKQAFIVSYKPVQEERKIGDCKVIFTTISDLLSRL